MTNKQAMPTSGLPASAGSGTPVPLAYANAPERVVSAWDGDVLRIVIPVTRAIRRSAAGLFAADVRVSNWFLGGLIFGQALVGDALHTSVWKRLRLSVAATLTIGAVTWVGIAWIRARLLRTVILQLDAVVLTTASPGRERVRRWDRHRIRTVAVRDSSCRGVGRLSMGQLYVTTGYDSPLTLATGPVADLEAVANDLRAALGLPAAARPPMPSAALSGRP